MCFKFNLCLVILIVLFSLFSSVVTLANAGVQNQPLLLTKSNYLAQVTRLLDQAKESISISQYLITYQQDQSNDPVFSLLEALVRARGRGVAVTVALEGTSHTLGDNLPSFNYLKYNGIDVYFDSPAVLNHEKVLVVDARYVVIGSHNWSRSAILYNQEKSVLLDDPVLAAQVLDDLPKKYQPGVEVPFSLLYSPQFHSLLSSTGYRQFDLYLVLLKAGDIKITTGNTKNAPSNKICASSPIPLDSKDLAVKIGLEPDQSGQSEVWVFLGGLEDKGLIKIDRKINPETGHQTAWLIIPPPDAVPAKVGIVIPAKAGIQENGPLSFEIPFVYWDYGYDRQLSLAAKKLYLTSLSETVRSPLYPWWSHDQRALAREYGISDNTVRDGLRELELANIQEVSRDLWYPEEGRDRTNRYCLNPLLSKNEIARAWQRLEDTYGPSKVGQARSYTAVLDEPNDPKTVALIITLMGEYGDEKVARAIKIVQGYDSNTGRHQVGYFVGVLKTLPE